MLPQGHAHLNLFAPMVNMKALMAHVLENALTDYSFIKEVVSTHVLPDSRATTMEAV